ncbi:hypothetical protein AB0E63_12775 [Kribbella sp. NPDC026596]|uniref:hypothetical protein n=1 Tax=Kribbella sp. NPDC026596 TaxID=3155122 RepID=UPI0033D86B58
MLFTAAQARVGGISRGVLRGVGYRRVLGPVYVAAHVAVTPRLLAEAALLLTPEAVVSHHTALTLWDADGPTDNDVHVSVQRDPHRTLPRIDGLRVHEVLNLERIMNAGLPLTPPGRTFLDLAPHSDLTELVTAGDSLVRRTHAEPAHLIDLTSAAIGVRGVRLAREAAALVRRGVDSPMESRLRLLLVLAGLPEPQVAHDIHDCDGGWLARPDLAYPNLKIAIEYDGRHHLVDLRQWRRDIRRRENLEREGWLLRVVTANDLLHAPATVVARITQDLDARRHPLAA